MIDIAPEGFANRFFHQKIFTANFIIVSQIKENSIKSNMCEPFKIAFNSECLYVTFCRNNPL